jgi:hypothetical protein
MNDFNSINYFLVAYYISDCSVRCSRLELWNKNI